MTESNFQACLKHVLEYEGGYSNDAGDPGGATQWGITHSEYDAYRRRKGKPTQDVRKISVQERDDIYRAQYWDAMRCDELPDGIDFVAFDAGVNAGVSQGAKFLQRALGIPADGHIGEETVNAAIQAHDKIAVIHAACDKRRDFYRALRTFRLFGKGWMRRTDSVETVATQMARAAPNAVNAAASHDDGASAKASVADLSEPMLDPQKAAVVGGGSGGIAGMIQQVQDQLSPYASAIKFAEYALVAIAVAGFGLTLYGLWHQNKTKEIAA